MRRVVLQTLALASFTALVMLFGLVATAAAQPGAGVVSLDAPIYLLPDAKRTPLQILPADTVLNIGPEEGTWLRVQFRDPRFGLRTGYVETRFVRIQHTERTRTPQSPERSATSAPSAEQSLFFPVRSASDRRPSTDQSMPVPPPESATVPATTRRRTKK